MYNSLDLFIVAGIAFFFLLGMNSGFLRSALSTLGVYLEIFLAQLITPVLIQAATILTAQEVKTGYVVIFFSIFVLILLIIELALTILRNIVNITVLGHADRILGALVSIFKALLIAGMIIEVLGTMPLSEEQTKYINQSYLAENAVNIFKRTYPLAIEAAQKTSQIIYQQMDTQVKQSSVAAVVNVVTSEVVKIKSTLE
jgi:membrane protein required for colicin V production